MWPDTVPDSCDEACLIANYSMYPMYTRLFRNAMYAPDQLRQRIAWALHKLVVVSADTVYQPSRMSPYLRLLDQHAFGNYRDLLFNVTLNPGMGEFLNMSTSTKYDPNENYAREILQLFTIGTEKLNPDGTTQNDGGGLPLPTYNQAVIDQLKLVFTGCTSRTSSARRPTAATTAGTTGRRWPTTRTTTTPTPRRSSRASFPTRP